MGNIASGKKAHRQSLRRRVFNLRRSRALKKALKEVRLLIAKKEKQAALEVLPKVYKAIDKAVKRGIIKKNNGSRKKSRITKAIDKIES